MVRPYFASSFSKWKLSLNHGAVNAGVVRGGNGLGTRSYRNTSIFPLQYYFTFISYPFFTVRYLWSGSILSYTLSLMWEFHPWPPTWVLENWGRLGLLSFPKTKKKAYIYELTVPSVWHTFQFLVQLINSHNIGRMFSPIYDIFPTIYYKNVEDARRVEVAVTRVPLTLESWTYSWFRWCKNVQFFVEIECFTI